MIVRCLICIPTYNNAGSIKEVVQEVLALTSQKILILDDGSETPVSTLVQESAQVKIHRFPKNQGKGAAIQKCFELAVKENFTHIITMDGDGQHKAHDLKLILDAIVENPWALIIGKRKFSGEHVPKSSQFGRNFSNFWVKYQTDIKVEDSQSGFRAYPLYFVQNLKFFTKKYDFEIEVLIRLIWKKVEVKEVAIDVYYPPPHERVSHFDKFWDNVKISTLNTVLVILSLMHSNMSRPKIAASLSLGVFLGVIPIYGFQMYLGMLFAFVFRLNFPLIFLAQQISLPPLIPIWTFISLKIGSALTGETLLISFDNAFSEAQRLIPVWFLGSFILGLILAAVTAVLSFALTMHQGEKKLWTGRDRGGKFGNWFMKTATLSFGPRLPYFFLYFICPYFYLFAPKAVLSHNQFFKITRPHLGFFRRQLETIKTFYKLGQILVDNIYSNHKGHGYFTSHRNGKELPFKMIRENKPLILVGAHVGAWMFAAKVFEKDELDGKRLKVNVVEFNAGAGLNASTKIEDQKIQYINNGDEAPIFKINQAINQNELLIFMSDRLVNHNVELVLFYGKLAAIDVAAFKIALAKKVTLSFSFAFKKGSREYDLFITPPVLPEEFAELDKQAALLTMTRKYTESLERFTQMYPTQWFNFYPFWSSVSSQNLPAYTKQAKHHLL